MKRILISILLSALLLSVFVGCNSRGDGAKEGDVKVVATNFVIYDMARTILGDEKNVTLLGKPGMDMHSYEPTAADILSIAEADVFVHIGGESDKWVAAALASAKNEKLVVVTLMDHVEKMRVGHSHDGDMCTEEHDGSATYDEHIWMSLENAAQMAKKIFEGIESTSHKNIDIYRKNKDEHIAKIAELDIKYAEMRKNAKRDTLLVADRFPFIYMTHELDIKYYAAFEGCSSETNASFATQAFLIEKTRELDLEYIIVTEGSSTSAVAQKISADTGAKILSLDSAQMVSADRMAAGESYISIMERNLQVLSEALG